MAGSPLGDFWRELRRRKVVRVALVYAVVGWALVEVASVVLPGLLLPDWSERLVLVLVIAGLPVALVLAWAFELSPDGVQRDRGGETAATPPAPAAAATAAVPSARADGRQSIAVLPMANLSGDAENEYFSDGISEEILTLLVRLPNLRVASRTSSFCFKGRNLDVRQIARELDVDWVLEGSVRRAGDRVRIAAQLIDASADAHVWSEIYDREIDDIFALQAEIAERIVASMRLSHGPRITTRTTTENVEAYDYYLRGRQYFHRAGNYYDHAVEMFRKAIDIDPDYALAHAGLADCAGMMAQWIDCSPENLALADSASRRALDLAPDLSEAHAARGFALSLQGDFDGAAAAFERAVRLDPQQYETWYLYGRARFAAGDFEAAAELWQKAHEVQPDEYQAACLRSLAFSALGRSEESLTAAGEAEAVTDAHLQRHPDDLRALGLSAGSLIRMGRAEEALARTDRALRLAPDDLSVLHNASCAYAQAGQTDRALELMHRRLAMGGTVYREWLEHDTDFDGMREDPRFVAILDSLPSRRPAAPGDANDNKAPSTDAGA